MPSREMRPNCALCDQHDYEGVEAECYRSRCPFKRSGADPRRASSDVVYEITGYDTSCDYEALAELMQRQSVVCIVDYGKDCRDVAHTLWHPSRSGGVWQLSGRGISYIYASTEEDFIEQCKSARVEVLMPTNL